MVISLPLNCVVTGPVMAMPLSTRVWAAKSWPTPAYRVSIARRTFVLSSTGTLQLVAEMSYVPRAFQVRSPSLNGISLVRIME